MNTPPWSGCTAQGQPIQVQALPQLPTRTSSESAPACWTNGNALCVNFNTSGPWFLPVDGFDEVVATAPNGKPMMVRKSIHGATHYLCTLMNLPPEAYEPIMKQAGVHRYHIGLHDPVWAGNDVLFLHAATSGPKSFNLRPGTRARAIIGPFQGTHRNGETFEAVAGMTYGFVLKND